MIFKIPKHFSKKGIIFNSFMRKNFKVWLTASLCVVCMGRLSLCDLTLHVKGRVTDITDEQSFLCLDERGDEWRLSLEGIEPDPLNKEKKVHAKTFLSDLVLDKEVMFAVRSRDKRTDGYYKAWVVIQESSKLVNSVMVQDGWAYTKPTTFRCPLSLSKTKMPEKTEDIERDKGNIPQKTNMASGDISKPKDLEELKIMEPTATNLPSNIGEMHELRKIIVIGTKLDTLPSDIGNLRKLEFLQVIDNRISYLPEEIGKCKALRVIHLTKNSLTSLPDEICLLVNLNHFSLPSNKISSLPDDIGNLKNLIVLNLFNNEISSLPVSIEEMKSLKILDLRMNKLESISSSLTKLSKVETLALEKNHIATLPEEIGNLTNLRNLNMRDNKLTKLPSSIGDLINLRHLDLRGNAIKHFPEEMSKLINLASLQTDALSIEEKKRLRRMLPRIQCKIYAGEEFLRPLDL